MTTDIPVPVSLSKTADRSLLVQWDNEVSHKIPFRHLRNNCRCAHCLENERLDDQASSEPTGLMGGQLPVLSIAETAPLDIVSMHPAGNYGYKVKFSDGHSSGIFSFELLYRIGESTGDQKNGELG